MKFGKEFEYIIPYLFHALQNDLLDHNRHLLQSVPRYVPKNTAPIISITIEVSDNLSFVSSFKSKQIRRMNAASPCVTMFSETSAHC